MEELLMLREKVIQLKNEAKDRETKYNKLKYKAESKEHKKELHSLEYYNAGQVQGFNEVLGILDKNIIIQCNECGYDVSLAATINGTCQRCQAQQLGQG